MDTSEGAAVEVPRRDCGCQMDGTSLLTAHEFLKLKKDENWTNLSNNSYEM